MIRPGVLPQDAAALVAIWRSAVDATHGFVDPADLDAIEARLASDYLPAVCLLVAEDADGVPVGFAGTAPDGSSLEMLFVHDGARGRGIGAALLAAATDGRAAVVTEVNEANEAALGFYRRHGFEVTGRDALDADGRPYPVLHLRRPAP